jgi:hypothetical protein
VAGLLEELTVEDLEWRGSGKVPCTSTVGAPSTLRASGATAWAEVGLHGLHGLVLPLLGVGVYPMIQQLVTPVLGLTLHRAITVPPSLVGDLVV